jgi:AhpD family alkylhydroperoxidase
MRDWNDYLKDLRATTRKMSRMNPLILSTYAELGEASAKSGNLDAKTRELIALAVSATRQRGDCISAHADAAAKNGATCDEILGTLGVAIAVSAGASLVCSARIIEVFAANALVIYPVENP